MADARAADPGCVLFLDVDGVLANSRSQLSAHAEDDPTLIHHPDCPSLERSCLAQLARIVTRTDCRIVVSSTWRLFPQMHTFLTDTFETFTPLPTEVSPEHAGVRPLRGALCGVTMELGDRGTEVATWLAEHPGTTRFAVLDDEHAESFAAALPAGHFVRTVMSMRIGGEAAGESGAAAADSTEGLTAEAADAVIAILLNGPAVSVAAQSTPTTKDNAPL